MAPFPLSLPGHDFRLQRHNQVKAKEMNSLFFKPGCGEELRFSQEIFHLLPPNHNYFTQGEVFGVSSEWGLSGLKIYFPLRATPGRFS